MANSKTSAYNQAIESMARNKKIISPMPPQSLMVGGDMRPNYNVPLGSKDTANVKFNNQYSQAPTMGVITKQQAVQSFANQSGTTPPQQETFFSRLISALSPKKENSQPIPIPPVSQNKVSAPQKKQTPAGMAGQYNSDYYTYLLPNLKQRAEGKPAYVPQTLPKDIPRDINALAAIIKSGLDKRGGSKIPIYNSVKDFAEAGSKFPEHMNPLTPVILALMESNGGQFTADPSANNPFNMYRPGQSEPVLDKNGKQVYDSNGNPRTQPVLARYGNFRNSLFGNNPEETLNLLDQVLYGDLYQDYSRTGQPTYLFNKYTPESDTRNPSNYELIDRFNKISDSLLGNIQP